MPPDAYRLDTVAVHLIERLEGSRRAWIGQPEEAARGCHRIVDETLERVVREQREIFGHAEGETLRRELMENFLPRYTRLAVDHNALEEEGYRAWRRGDPVSRVVGTLGAVMGALVLERLIHSPWTLLAFVGALFVPFIPELRAWHFRRRYRGLLREVVDDMGRVQDELDRYTPALPVAEPSNTGSENTGPREESVPILLSQPNTEEELT